MMPSVSGLAQTSVREFFPSIYDGVEETDQLIVAEDQLFADFLDMIDLVWANNFISSADGQTVTDLERLFGIRADISEGIEFRRQRLLNRLAMMPPYTLRFLANRLDAVIGAGLWDIGVDYANRTLIVETIADSPAWANEISVTITQLKPANMVFVSRPRIASGIALGDRLFTRERQNNYRLGVSWYLSPTLPFASQGTESEVTAMSSPSLTAVMLNETAGDVADNIASAKINGTYTVPAGSLTKTILDNLVTVAYIVPESAGLSQITRIQLLDSVGRTLLDTSVYVDASYSVEIKHTITVSEAI